jgi:predicted dienelactone hydrolase
VPSSHEVPFEERAVIEGRLSSHLRERRSWINSWGRFSTWWFRRYNYRPRLPLVLISHGPGGSDGRHFDTVLALAGAGFVVVALTHTGNNYLDQSYAGNQKNLTDRPRQVSAVLAYMLTSWTQYDHLDAALVGMFGFSLDAFTTPAP